MNSSKVWSRNTPWLTAAGALLISSGCSLLYDFNTQQCNTTVDCTHKGSQFTYSVCQNHVCVQTIPGTGGSSAGGAPAAGGDSSLGGGDGNTGGAPPGTGGAPSCSNARCIADHTGLPWTCRNETCVPLTTTDCPILIPQNTASELIKTQGVIVVGGFAQMSNTSDLHDTQAVINWDMAFDEFNSYTIDHGLPSYSGSGVRPLVGLICHGDNPTTDSINAAMKQLSDVVQVPAILSTLSTNFLYQAWQYLHPDLDGGVAPPSIFFMSTGSADLRLANLQDDGLMWHMLGDPRTLAATTVGLLKQIEPYVNAQRLANGDDPAANPLRVTLVYSDDPILLDIASLLTASAVDATHPAGTILTFNNKLAIANGSAFRQVQIDSALQHANPVVSNAVTDLRNNPPHVIVGMASSEFPKTVLPSVENTWTTYASGQIRPFYLLSHRIYNGQELKTVAGQFSTTTPSLSMRTVGVNYAQAQDQHAVDLYNTYLSRLSGTYSGTLSLTGTENYYDGAYYLLYSIAAAAAARVRPTADDIAAALTSRIISTSGSATQVDVGRDAIAGIGTGVGTITQLFNNIAGYKMSLYGCEGAPDFDRLTGTRLSPTSAWCILSNGQYQPDGLIFNSTAKTYSTPTAGVPSCLQNYCKAQADAGVADCPLN